MIYIKYKSVLIICIFLTAFLCFNAVCANDVNQTSDITTLENDDNDLGQISESDDVLTAQSADEDAEALKAQSSNKINAQVKTSSATVFVKDSKFNIRISDDNGTGIAKQPVYVKYNNNLSVLTTNSNGYAYILLDAKGTFTITYKFNSTGYTKVSGSKQVTVVGNTVSKIKGPNYVAYVGANNPFKVTLTAGGVKMPNQKVTFKFNGKTYTRKTDSDGVATLKISTGKKGTYTVVYSFKGSSNVKSASGKAKITVKKGMPTKIVNQKIYVYKHKKSSPFVIKYRDVRGDPIASKTIVFTINKKTYKVKTDEKGLAKINIKLPKGVYSLKISSYNTKTYKKSSNTYSIRVISDKVNYKNNGFWLFGADMNKVDLSTMAKNGINNIFLNFYAVELHGKTAVSNFAKQARSLGIDVHIWMQVFYKGGSWVSPVDDNGKYKYSLFNSIISEAKSYAKIDGVAGIHFDYLRFPGTAYKHTNGVKAINYFTKKACSQLHALNSNLIISAAVMPEPSSMKYYYGQDIPTLSKYLDVIVPMVYKGNYNQGTSWIKSITSTFVGQSNGAQIWTGLQSYKSDSNVVKLSASALRTDAVYAVSGGATGVMLFRYTLFNLFDFDTL